MTTDKLFSLWPIAPFGGEENEGGSGAGSGAGEGNAAGNPSGQGGQGNSGKGGSGTGSGDPAAGAATDDDDDDSDDDEFKGLSAAELKRVAKDNAKKAKDAEKERKKAQDKIDAEERKKNDDVTNLTKDLDDERKVSATLRATVTKQAIEAAIRDDDRWTWHDVEMVATVAAQINSEISVTDDGKVEGLKATLPKVAKQHPFLVKTSKEDNGDGKNNGNNGTGNGGGQSNNGSGGPTGFQPGQGGTSGGAGNEIDTKKLAENYPALASRI